MASSLRSFTDSPSLLAGFSVAAFRTLVRVLLVLALWVGVSGAASVPAAVAPARVTELAGQSDLQARLLDLFGGVGICGDDDDSEDVLCGGDVLVGLVSDPAMLLMSRGQCSRLLELLYRQQVCDAGMQDCGQLDVGGLPPAPLRSIGPGGGAAGLLALHNAALVPLRDRLRVARPRDDPDPTSYFEGPASPPPRAALA